MEPKAPNVIWAEQLVAVAKQVSEIQLEPINPQFETLEPVIKHLDEITLAIQAEFDSSALQQLRQVHAEWEISVSQMWQQFSETALEAMSARRAFWSGWSS